MSLESVPSPRFTEDDLPLSGAQMRQRETWMMEHGNWRDDHSVPSVGKHYRYMWKWDSTKAVVINARRNDPDRSATELTTLLSYIDPRTGFIPNKIFATAGRKTWRDYPEALFFNNNKIGTSYSQPPLEAWAAMETYDSFCRARRQDEGLEFLRSVYGVASPNEHTGLNGSYDYFAKYRQNAPDDYLIGIVHPNETGRDSDEANKPWLLDTQYDPRMEWLKMQKFGWDIGRLGRDPARQRIDWVPQQVREKYWVNDVMFNSMYASNLRRMDDIATLLYIHADTFDDDERYAEDAERYSLRADKVEAGILERMWDGRQGYFYNLDKRGEQIPVDSVTGLFPLMLEGIREDQLVSLVDKLEDPRWFNTRYPVPTHAVRSPFYAPDPEGFKNTFTPQWSGTVWTDVNHFLVEEGLVPRAEDLRRVNKHLSSRMIARGALIADMTQRLLAINPKTMEYYSPNTGKGMRVTDFMWTNLGLHFEKLEEERRS